MRRIALTHGLETVVDDSDFEVLSQFKWHASSRCGPWIYAKTMIERKLVGMHNLLMPALDGCVIDHIDGDGLNNQRSNLRHATPVQNGWNRRVGKNSTSGYKGVSFNKKAGKYSVVVGGFETAEEAARAADVVMRIAHGDFARPNFPEGD